MTNLPLNGYRVIDLTAHRAGPTAVRPCTELTISLSRANFEEDGRLMAVLAIDPNGPNAAQAKQTIKQLQGFLPKSRR